MEIFRPDDVTLRILDSCSVQDRRVCVEHTAAFNAYCALDGRINPAVEAYLSAFWFGPEFKTHLETTRSTAGYDGRCGAHWLWLDIDRAKDLECALRDARGLVGFILDTVRSFGEDDLLIFTSGGKGFHIGVPTLWNPTPSTNFNRAARRFAEAMADEAKVRIDTNVYDKVRAFRCPKSRHPKTGLYKRRLTYDEFMNLSLDAILKLATNPAPFDLPTPRLSAGDIALLARRWADAERAVEQAKDAAAIRRSTEGPGRVNRATLEFIRDGAPEGERALRLFSAAANCAEFKTVEELTHAIQSEAALDTGLPPKEIFRQIECGLNHAKGKPS